MRSRLSACLGNVLEVVIVQTQPDYAPTSSIAHCTGFVVATLFELARP